MKGTLKVPLEVHLKVPFRLNPLLKALRAPSVAAPQRVLVHFSAPRAWAVNPKKIE